jgi:hypothetical protein
MSGKRSDPSGAPRTRYPVPLVLETPSWVRGTLGLVATETTPNPPILQALLSYSKSELERELAEIERQRAQLEIHQSLIRLTLRLRESADTNGKKETAVEQPTVRTRKRRGEGPSLREAISVVMAERPGVWMSDDIMTALEAHGWAPRGTKPRNQLGNRLREMVDRGELMRVGKGYALVATRSGPVGTLLGAGDKSPS